MIRNEIGAAAFLVVLSASPVGAQSFLPDLSFNTEGFVVQQEQDEDGDAKWRVASLALTSDGGVVTGSGIMRGPDRSIAISRYAENGDVVSAFGVDGVVEVPFGTTLTTSPALIERPDGKLDIVCTNFISGGLLGLYVIQLLPDGSLDPSWGEQGIATHAFVNGSAFSDIALRPTGELIISGGVAGDMVVVQLDQTGQLDPTFGTEGVAALSLPGRSVMAMCMQLTASGTVYLGGYRSQGWDTAAWAFGAMDPAGAPLIGFGTDGISVIDNIPDNSAIPTNAQEIVDSIVLDPEGNIYFGASAAITYGDERGAIGRLFPDGTLDPSFGIDGIFFFRPDTTKRVWISSIFLEPTGQVVVVAIEYSTGGQLLLLRTDLGGNILNSELNGGYTRDTTPFAHSSYSTRHADALTLQGRLLFASAIAGVSYGRSVIMAFVLNDELTTGLPVTAPESSMYALAPNPCNGSFALLGTGSITPLTALRLYDAQGALVADYSGQLHTVDRSAATSFQLPSQRAAGLYRVVLDTSTGRTALPLVVE